MPKFKDPSRSFSEFEVQQPDFIDDFYDYSEYGFEANSQRFVFGEMPNTNEINKAIKEMVRGKKEFQQLKESYVEAWRLATLSETLGADSIRHISDICQKLEKMLDARHESAQKLEKIRAALKDAVNCIDQSLQVSTQP
jgi:hypothetical protein